MDQNTGKYIIFIGIGVIVVGILIYFLHDKLHWIGRLPGDIRIEKENSGALRSCGEKSRVPA